jgi:hypothetical protein
MVDGIDGDLTEYHMGKENVGNRRGSFGSFGSFGSRLVVWSRLGRLVLGSSGHTGRSRQCTRKEETGFLLRTGNPYFGVVVRVRPKRMTSFGLTL